ncbi:MAG TPA: 4-hydroxy-tetrahydrodipicolinate reductase [Patescibacteria group bacterium]|nr:4-hydroxy-tetrahydrodipicolinate reductase [Patescibacteria group bacterium]
MKIALIGYGNMGQEIEKVVNEGTKHQISSISSDSRGFDEDGIKNADVVIDFSSPEAALENIQRVLKLGKNMVVGTSGWYEHIDKVDSWVKEAGTGLIYGQNFAIGTNIFFRLVETASRLCAKYGNYDVYGYEVHHSGKKDSPSGTAFKTAQTILDNFPKKKKLQTGRLDRKIETEELHFASIRGGRNPGMHEVVFDSAADSIVLSDQNHSRRGYAEGAVMAAEFIQDKKGVYAFDEIIK